MVFSVRQPFAQFCDLALEPIELSFFEDAPRFNAELAAFVRSAQKKVN